MQVYGAMSAVPVPGTAETYAQRAEAVTRSVKDALRRELTAEQYRAFEALGHDRPDIDVPANPWEGFVLDVQRRRQPR